MTYGTTMDWLSYTVAWENLSPDLWVILTDMMQAAAHLVGVRNDWTIDKGLHGYRLTLNHNKVDGLRVMVSSPDSNMGVHVQMGGTVLRTLGVDYCINQCLHWHGKPSRVDLAIDVMGKADVADCDKAWDAGEAVTRAKTGLLIKSNTGKTFYVGKRTSDRFLRVYDKGGETGTGVDWTRIEIECKRELASMAFHGYRLYGGSAVREKIQSFCDFPTIEWWNDAMNSVDTVDSLPKEQKLRDTRKWLMESVVGAFAREMLADDEFVGEFMEAVANKIKEMRDGK